VIESRYYSYHSTILYWDHCIYLIFVILSDGIIHITALFSTGITEETFCGTSTLVSQVDYRLLAFLDVSVERHRVRCSITPLSLNQK
jgi:hypothetical protein